MIGSGRGLDRCVIGLAVVLTAALTGIHAQPPATGVQLHSRHEALRARIAAARDLASAECARWLGPATRPSLTIADTTGADVVIRPASWSAPAVMDVEAHVAFGVARSWWPARVADDVAGVTDGAAWYLQSRIVEQLYDRTFKIPAYGADTLTLFGGHLRWAFPGLSRSRWTAGLGRHEFLRGGAPVLSTARPLPPSVHPDALRLAAAFGTLERLVGWPALQGALQQWVRRASAGPMNRPAVVAVIGDATGQDLTWFFAVAFEGAHVMNYRVTSVESVPATEGCAAPCYRTRVTVAREGQATFSGSSRAPSGAYDSGDAVQVLVRFEDGQQAVSRWDGRAAERSFEFESAAPAVLARVNPDGGLLLDGNALDDVWRRPAATNIPVTRWAAQWLVWLQHAMLSYAALV